VVARAKARKSGAGSSAVEKEVEPEIATVDHAAQIRAAILRAQKERRMRNRAPSPKAAAQPPKPKPIPPKAAPQKVAASSSAASAAPPKSAGVDWDTMLDGMSDSDEEGGSSPTA
jgi:hypothetical protein